MDAGGRFHGDKSGLYHFSTEGRYKLAVVPSFLPSRHSLTSYFSLSACANVFTSHLCPETWSIYVLAELNRVLVHVFCEQKMDAFACIALFPDTAANISAQSDCCIVSDAS